MENQNSSSVHSVSAVRKIHFCYGHRVMGHENKCGSLHGHNGILWIYAASFLQVDEIGRVIDFSNIKNIIGSWVDEHWDHTMIIFKEDQLTLNLLSQAPSFKKVFVLETNPTAENMASYLLNEICPILFKGAGIFIHKIVFYETENCFVEVQTNLNPLELYKIYN